MLAITLARRDFREVDQHISLYTFDQGKIEVIARGVKKSIAKNAPALEPFSIIDIELAEGRELTYLTKAYTVEAFIAIRNNLASLYAGSAALSLVEQHVKNGEKDSALVALLVSFLRFLNTTPTVGELPVYSFMLQLVQLLGFSPVLGTCVLCAAARTNAFKYIFSPSLGGLVCSACATKNVPHEVLLLTAGGVALFEQLLSRSFAEPVIRSISRSTLLEIIPAIERFIEYHTGKRALRLPAGIFGKSGEKLANLSKKR